MRTRLGLAGLIVGAVLAMSAPANAALMLCGIADGTVGDLNPAMGQVTASCTSPAGTFTGTLREFQRRHYDTLILDGALTGTGSFAFSNNYNIGPWRGQGEEWALLFGDYRSGVAGTMGSATVTAFASTFSANSATATDTDDDFLAGSQTRHGRFGGPGALLGSLTWDAGRGVIDVSADIGVSVPEPASWALFILGFGSLGAIIRRRRLAPATVS